MQSLQKITSRFIPLRIENVDTDQIIPARFLKATTKEGFGKNLFRDWRYENDDETKPKNDFVLSPRNLMLWSSKKDILTLISKRRIQLYYIFQTH